MKAVFRIRARTEDVVVPADRRQNPTSALRAQMQFRGWRFQKQQSQSNGQSGVSPPSSPSLSSCSVKIRRPSAVRLRSEVPRLSVKSCRSGATAGGLAVRFELLLVEDGVVWVGIREEVSVTTWTGARFFRGFFASCVVGVEAVVVEVDGGSAARLRFFLPPSASICAVSDADAELHSLPPLETALSALLFLLPLPLLLSPLPPSLLVAAVGSEKMSSISLPLPLPFSTATAAAAVDFEGLLDLAILPPTSATSNSLAMSLCCNADVEYRRVAIVDKSQVCEGGQR